MYSKTTHDIKITVAPNYLETQSAPDNQLFVWAYTIQMDNLGERALQLINRYWQITDANGHVQRVHGEGVVGEQPKLAPGERFQYTSGVPLRTPSGLMMGHYEMVTDHGEKVIVDIPPFSLDSPLQTQRPN